MGAAVRQSGGMVMAKSALGELSGLGELIKDTYKKPTRY